MALPGIIAAGVGTAMGAVRSFIPRIATAIGAVTPARAWSLVRRHGLVAAATAMGVGAAELAAWMLSNPRPPRRRRGISSRDIRTTKRVVGFVNRMQKDIGCVTRRRK